MDAPFVKYFSDQKYGGPNDYYMIGKSSGGHPMASHMADDFRGGVPGALQANYMWCVQLFMLLNFQTIRMTQLRKRSKDLFIACSSWLRHPASSAFFQLNK
uniref:Carboxylic ester hydrolase n=1 Tax=Romanomermis culicivorax TaxID=13658 RepID=A0A915L1F9_ROMCU